MRPDDNNQEKIRPYKIVGLFLLLVAFVPGLTKTFLLQISTQRFQARQPVESPLLVGTIGEEVRLYSIKPRDTVSDLKNIRIDRQDLGKFQFYIATDNKNQPLRLSLQASDAGVAEIKDKDAKVVGRLRVGQSAQVLTDGRYASTATNGETLPNMLLDKVGSPVTVDVTQPTQEVAADDGWDPVKSIWSAKFLPRSNILLFYAITFVLFICGFCYSGLKSRFKGEAWPHTLTKKSLVNIPILVFGWFVGINTLDLLSSDFGSILGLVGLGIQMDDSKWFW